MDFNKSEPRRETVFKDAVLSAAEAKAMEIIGEAQRESTRQIAQAQSQCGADSHDAAEKTLRPQVERERSAAAQAARRALLEHRAALVGDMFCKVEERLRAFVQSEGYPAWLAGKASACPTGGQAPAVHLCGADMRHAAAIKAVLPDARVTEDPAIKIGGLKVGLGRMLYDMTLDTALEEERDLFTKSGVLTV